MDAGSERVMTIEIRGHGLPGRRFRSDGVVLENVHVALQERADAVGLVAGDAMAASWRVAVRVVVDDDGDLDVRGPAVHGRRGARFVYLTWGDVGDDGSFAMFRRAKLMLTDVDDTTLRAAAAAGRLVADVDMTDERGGPRCARVVPPAIRWSVGSAA